MALAVAACAKVEPPPGGPPDTTPPQLVGVFPDSVVSLPGFHGEVEFRFDEVVSEGSMAGNSGGTGDLQRLIILSPSTRAPKVDWKRSRIGVRPSEGWQPDRTYRVELLPGITDLRNNRATRMQRVVTFSTGGPVPADTLRGRIMDWTTGRPVPQGLVEALLMPDSLSYRARADSAGNFEVAPLPAGTYLVYGVVDQNSSLRRDPREAFDSATVTSNNPARTLWTFPHDTTPPRLRQATALDSLTVQLEFSQPLDPAQHLDTSIVTVRRLPDSARVAVAALVSSRVRDSLQRAERHDSTAAILTPPAAVQRDSAPGREPLIDQLILELAAPMDSAGKYAVELRGVRNVTGIAADVRGVFVAPVPRPQLRPTGPDSMPADSLLPDSLRAKPETLPPTPKQEPAAPPRR